MSSLYAFLNPEPITKTKKITLSPRFKNEDGSIAYFEVKTISQEENERLSRKATRSSVVRGQRVESFDSEAYTNALIVACTVVPDFTDAELCKAYGVLDPTQVPARMLSAGEYSRLSAEILAINEFDKETPEALEDDAKN